MSILNIEPKEKIQAAIIDLQYRKVYDARNKSFKEMGNPFFAYLAMMLKPKVMTPEKPIRTMCVNGKGELEFDLDFVDKLTPDETMGVVCHEILHISFLHLLRREGRHAMIANIAQDMAVNCLVTQEGITLPKIGVRYSSHNDSAYVMVGQQKIEAWNISKKAWEQIYDEIYPQLKDNPQLNSPSNNKGYGGLDEHEIGTEYSEEASEQAEKWQRKLAEAANYAKQQGKFSAGVGRLIDSIFKPKVRWAEVLLNYIQPYLMPTDLSYQQPNKKSQVLGVYMPSVVKEHMEIEVVIDTSGSIGNEELKEFISELIGIQDSFPTVEMTLNFADVQIQSKKSVRDMRSEVDSLDIKGGGGTSMENALEELAIGTRANCVVVFTDGRDSYSHSSNDFPFDVVWVLSKQGKELNDFESNGPKYGMRFKLN